MLFGLSFPLLPLTLCFICSIVYVTKYFVVVVVGVMNPPILVDLNKDGTVDITMAMYNTTIIAFDGETYERLWDFVFPSSESYS